MSENPRFRYLHVGIAFAGQVKIKELEPMVASISGDWIRYGFNLWVLWTPMSVSQCVYNFRIHLSPQDNLLAVVIDPVDKDGWLPPWAWEWLNRQRPEPNPNVNQLAEIRPPPPPPPPPPPRLLPPPRSVG